MLPCEVNCDATRVARDEDIPLELVYCALVLRYVGSKSKSK
jgi:hypothetical protein